MVELTIEQKRALALARARVRLNAGSKSGGQPASDSGVRPDAIMGLKAIKESEGPSAADPFKVAPPMDFSISALGSEFQPVAGSGGGMNTPEAKALVEDIGRRKREADATPLNSKMLGIAQGGSFGFSDELGAAMISPFSDATYGEVRDTLRGSNNAAAATNPGAYYSGQMLGAIPVSGGAYGLAEKGVSKVAPSALTWLGGLPARVGLGSLAGATEGAVYGAGTADGGDISDSMKKNALIGGLVGAAAPAALAGVGAAFNAVKNPIQSMFNIPSATRAGSAIETVMSRAGKTPDDIAEAIRAATAEGQGVFNMADALGHEGQRALTGIAKQPGSARQMIVDALTARQDGQANRLSPFLADALDAKKTAKAVGGDMTAKLRSEAKTAFDEAAKTAGPVDVRPAVASLDETINQMRGSGINPPRVVSEFEALRGKLSGVTAKGEPTTLSDYRSVLALWREVKDDINKAFKSGDGSLGEALKPIRDQLEDSLSAASDGFKAANAMYRSGKSAIGAIDEGSAATSSRVRADDTITRVSSLNEAERSAFAKGYADPLIAKVESSAPGVNKARPLLDEKHKLELSALAKDPALLERQIARENTMFETAAKAKGGPATAENLADIADAKSMSSSVIGNLLTGNWGSAGRQITDKLVSGATGSNAATRKLIAEALLSKAPKQAVAAIEDWRATKEPIRKLIETLVRSGAIQAPGQ